ncbi:hypothetical protein Tco_0934476, partial [Tanacetum coccineum]
MPPRLRKHTSGHSKRLKKKKTEESNKKEFGSMHRYVKIKSNNTSENLNVDTSDNDSSNDESGDDVKIDDINVDNMEANNINYYDDVDEVDDVVGVNDHDHENQVGDQDANVNVDHVDIFDPKNWNNLTSDMIKVLVAEGPKRDKSIDKADDQAIQTILLGLPEDIYVAVDSCETAQEIWLRVQQMMKGSDIGIQEKKAKLFNEWEMFTSTDGESIESYYYRFSKLMNDFKINKHYPEKIASNLKFLNNLQPEWGRHVTIVHQTKDLHTTDYTQLYDFLKYNQKEVDELRAKRLAKSQDPLALMANSNNPTTAMNMALILMAKAFKLNYSTPTNNNQRISSNPYNRQIAQPGMNMGQDKQMQMVGGNDGNQFRQYARQNVGNQNGYNAVQNVGHQNPNGNGNVVAARAEGNPIGN